MQRRQFIAGLGSAAARLAGEGQQTKMELAWISTARNSANIALASLSLSDSFDSAFYPRLLAKIVF